MLNQTCGRVGKDSIAALNKGEPENSKPPLLRAARAIETSIQIKETKGFSLQLTQINCSTYSSALRYPSLDRPVQN